MAHPTRIAIIGNALPRRCGIATFTGDLHAALMDSAAKPRTCIAAINDPGANYDYPPAVTIEIEQDRVDSYVRAAGRLNAEGWDVVSLQHEFGIFGGEAGSHILALLSRLDAPVVTTVHTVLEDPTPCQAEVFKAVVARSARVVVMAEKGRALLESVYGAPADKIRVIPHGIPDYPFVEPDRAKARLGFAGRTVILTFGLLSPGKGVEVMIDAMPRILKTTPDAVYVVLGATHPNLIREEGQAYRERLRERVAKLGLGDHVVLLDAFVDQPRLLDFISMCDVYVTPYLDPRQMTSGTLAYSYGLGKVVVSTPYWHAQELLADGRGVLTPFGDSKSIGSEIAGLFGDPARRQRMRRDAYVQSRSMTWARTAESYLEVFEDARGARQARPRLILAPSPVWRDVPIPPPRTDYFMSMCDDTGIFQHAVHAVPDRLHGYCVDDNARALLVACALNGPGETPLPEALTTRFAAFVQHAWNPDLGRFRNFMSFDRRWLEPMGSEDSHGRTVWALGVAAETDSDASRRTWAAGLFRQALPPMLAFTSPRAWAFALLGLDGYMSAHPDCPLGAQTRRVLAARLLARLISTESPDWVWFENGLSYDNPRLCQALIVTGMAIKDPRLTAAGLRALKWLTRIQTGTNGVFRPVGSDTFGLLRQAPRPFDQQPLEAAAAISAVLAAWRADGDGQWKIEAARAFAWFTGANDLGLPLVDVATGSCRDGLHPMRRNENRGGESVVSYLLGAVELRQSRREAIGGPALVAVEAVGG